MTEISHIIQTRNNFITLINNLTEKELNAIPTGFKNNIIWNFGHIVVVQQLLCYKNSGLEISISQELIEKYKKGTSPQGFVSQSEIEELINISKHNMEKFLSDIKSKDFSKYKEYPTSYSVILKSIEDAIKFNSLHEGLHFGYAMALRKLVKQN